MTGRTKFILSIAIIVAIFALFVVAQIFYMYTRGSKTRSTASLLNQYYKLVKHNPDAAKRDLELILNEEPTNIIAMRELGNWYLQQGDTNAALKQFEKVHKLYANDAKTIQQLNSIYSMIGSTNKIEIKNSQSIEIAAAHIPEKYNDLINKLTAQNLATDIQLPQEEKEQKITETSSEKIATALKASTTNTVSERDRLLNEFYQNRTSDQHKAWAALNSLLTLYPYDETALREAGYYALNQDKKELSVIYLERAYQVSHDPMLALQLGYILDGLKQKRLAYHYFDLATCATKPEERMKAELAKTNLRGMQTRFLPDPFFANLLLYPFYQSRFKLIIYPIIARVGVVVNQEYNVSIYTSYRHTSDNKSSTSGQISQIYEDNAAISALGIQATPFPKMPSLLAFMEGGKAIDLVYKNRGRWRNDFRAGLVYYNDWGKEARYTFEPTLEFKFNADIYGDLIYYSRFLDYIGTVRVRPGFEVFRFGSTAFNLYLKGFLVEDRNREFYNNIFEYGPGLAFTPSDRFNFSIRYECLRGVYLPASSPSPNPYSKTYHNNMFFLDTYVGF